ncbi:uncharacterized protein A4U43_C08F32410 [Asparagus officinalis]|nr:uncharacterized protein A4U43_C08F32410 [Asparagus officinalis]
MVMLAEKMRLKLLSGSTSQASAGEEEMGSKQEMQDWMLSIGIISPVTKESAGAMYHQQLSRQLADFVKLPLEKAGGMMAVIDIYCLFNRARGTELISPEDLLQACALWEKIDVPVMLRKFDSGVMVIQNKAHSDEEVFARIKSLAEKPDALRTGISPSDAALTLGIAPALAKEHLLTAETKGLLCRDISPDGFRFYANLFIEFDPKNIYRRNWFTIKYRKLNMELAKLASQCIMLEYDKMMGPFDPGPPNDDETMETLSLTDYMELLVMMFGEPDMSLENMDILEVAAMRGIKFDPPRWHRPGGLSESERANLVPDEMLQWRKKVRVLGNYVKVGSCLV